MLARVTEVEHQRAPLLRMFGMGFVDRKLGDHRLPRLAVDRPADDYTYIYFSTRPPPTVALMADSPSTGSKDSSPQPAERGMRWQKSPVYSR